MSMQKKHGKQQGQTVRGFFGKPFNLKRVIFSIFSRNLTLSALILIFGFFIMTKESYAADLSKLKNGLYAVIQTKYGEMVVELEYKKAALTVANFVGLAEATKKSNRDGKRFFDGLTFHRVVADFVIQGGDPEGRGTGGPGYSFEDEFDASLRHDRKGILSMANSGPNSNGSQFFITFKETPWLDDKHTVFGSVVLGLDIIDKIKEGDAMEKVTIERRGAALQSYKADEAFFQKLRQAHAQRVMGNQDRELQGFLDEQKKEGLSFSRNSQGIYYAITRPGSGSKPKAGFKVSVHYVGKFLSGKSFDDSYSRGKPLSLTLQGGQVIKGFDLSIADMLRGEKRSIVLPPELAYGDRSVGPIPANSFLVFELELLSFTAN